MPTPAPSDTAPAGAPATDKPVAPAVTSGRVAPAPATAVTADTIEISGKRTYTVAPGRTVSHGHPKPDGAPDGTIGKVDHLAEGDTVELEEADAKRLIELGFLLAPDGSRVIFVDGPATNVENGVSITRDLKDGGATVTTA